MKRRLFLKGLLGASVIAPVVVKAVTKDEFNGWLDETGELPEISVLPKRITLMTPQQISNEALSMLNADLEKNIFKG